MAGFVYLRVPLGPTSAQGTEPTFGFRFDQSYDDRLTAMSSDAPAYAEDILLPPALDLNFTADGLHALKLVGMDTVPMLAALGFHTPDAETPEEQQQIEQEHFWMFLTGGLLVAAGIGIGVCFAVDECGDDDSSSSSSSPSTPGGLASD
jgi:hypothetical protein